MGKSAPDAPAVPDPARTAAAQSQANIDTARAQANLNRVNQYTPTGSQVYRPVTSSAWDEASYLAANPDVAQAIQSGSFQGNGLTHYQKFGQAEGRSGVAQGYFPPEDRWEAITTLSPEQQRLLDLTQRAQIQFGETANAQLAKLSGILSQPLDFSSAGTLTPTITADGIAIPQANIGYGAESRDRVEDALFQRLNPHLETQRASLDARLRNQGLTPGSEAWNTAMREIAMTENDARLGVVAAGGQEEQLQANIANALFGQRMAGASFDLAQRQAAFGQADQARQRAIEQILAQRQIPLNEIAAMLGGSQVSYPQFSPAPQVNVAPTDYLGAVGQQQAGQNAAWQGQVAATQANNTAAAGAATAAITAAAIIA